MRFWINIICLFAIGGLAACKPTEFKGSPFSQKPSEQPKTFDEKLDDGDLFEPEIAGVSVSKRLPKIALLVNDVSCSFCHAKINGDVLSTETVNPVWTTSLAQISGSWWHAEDFKANVKKDNNWGNNVNFTATDGIKPLPEKVDIALPRDRNKDGKPDFPELDFTAIESRMKGSVVAGSTKIVKVATTPVVLVGTDEKPIELNGEVLIKGDLIIKGRYKGVGNIYVTGNIYIPGDIKASKSPYPYPADRNAARKKAAESVKNKDDALGLATAKSIIVNDFESHGAGNVSVFESSLTPAADKMEVIGARAVYDWYPGGKAEFEKLYDTFDIGCGNRGNNKRSISLIDATLYAKHTIGGRANRNSYAINGSIIARSFHIISGASACPAGTHPVHGLDQQFNHINYDWRIDEGLLILKQIAQEFQ